MNSARSSRRSPLRLALKGSAVMAALLLLASNTGAQQAPLPFEEDPTPAAPAPPAEAPDDEYLAADWRDYALELRDRVVYARARLAAAERAYTKGRHRRKMRGEVREEAIAEREDARRALVEAEKEWAALPDRAHRAGVPPGWIRPALDG